MTLRLGLIGLSPGNGHPYSWAAIVNGYDAAAMKQCGFPVIPEYLGAQSWPAARLPGAQVTHVWTQTPAVSSHVAAAALIPHVVAEPEAMLGQVDALLLARDDAENHLRFARPFLEAGLPVYVDKPAALSLRELDRLYALQRHDGQLFTCSALRYARELVPGPEVAAKIGALRQVHAVTGRRWDRYAIHVIEPVLKMMGGDAAPRCERLATLGDGGSLVRAGFGDVTATLAALGEGVAGPIAIRLHGASGWHELAFHDSFSAFRSALQDFLEGIRTRSARSPAAFNRRVVSIIEAGLA